MQKKVLILSIVLVLTAVVVFTQMFGKNTSTNTSAPTTATGSTTLTTSSPSPIPSDATPSADSTSSLQAGLKIEDIKVGTGKEVKSGDTIKINYLGTLENGQKFDSSYDRKEPFETQIGVGQVIKGWDLGVIGMKVGGKRKLTIPSELGYGSRGAGNVIPPNATLIFELELLDVK